MKELKLLDKKRNDIENEIYEQFVEDLIKLQEDDIILVHYNMDMYDDINYFTQIHMIFQRETSISLHDLKDDPYIIDDEANRSILSKYNKFLNENQYLIDKVATKWKLEENFDRIKLRHEKVTRTTE